MSVMIYVFYGEDDFSLAKALVRLKEEVGPEAVREANIQEVEGTKASLNELQMMGATVPFLAERRLIVIRGLLTLFEGRSGGRGKERGPQGQWEGLEEVVKSLPPTTDVAFVDGRLSRGNPLLRRLTPPARVREFSSLRGEALRRWIQDRVAYAEGSMTPAAVRLLSDLVGGNLWVLDGEVEKLVLYCGRSPIGEEDVRTLVAVAREASAYAAIDALLEEGGQSAGQLFDRLLAAGVGVPYIMALLARQLRQLVLAQELLSQGATPQQVGQRLVIRWDFLLRKTVEQAQRHTLGQLRDLYRRLVELDLAIKTGEMAEDLGLQLLVAETRWGNGEQGGV